MTVATEIEYVPIETPKPAAERERERPRKSNAGRKSNEERARRAAEAAERQKLAEVEAKRATRLQPDTNLTRNVLVVIAVIVIATAFAVSYATMVAVAGWMKLPIEVGWLAYAVPGFIELLVIFSTVDYILERSRGKRGTGPLWAIVALSAVAVLGNASHTIREWGAQFGGTNWQSYIGVALSALAPLVVVYVAKRLSALVFAEVAR